jgi:diguanylate cyclase (GGDEF)-like protein
MHIYVNSAYLNLFGYQNSEDVDGLPVLDLIASEDHHKFKTVFRQFAEQPDADPVVLNSSCVRADNSHFRAKIEFSHARVEGEDCMQVVIRDEDEFAVDETQAHEFRDHDLLTGLFTRIRFADEFEKIAFNAVEGRGDADLLYIVLDEFQAIKEQVGLATSDNIIQSIADLLDNNRAEDEVLARYSDQVFTVIIPNQNAQQVDERAASYLKAVGDFVSHANGKIIDVKCSIGIARITESQSAMNIVLENADKACIQAQKNGGNQFSHFQPDTLAVLDSASNKEWDETFKQALAQNNFSL